MEEEMDELEITTIMEKELDDSLEILIESQIENEKFKKRGIEL